MGSKLIKQLNLCIVFFFLQRSVFFFLLFLFFFLPKSFRVGPKNKVELGNLKHFLALILVLLNKLGCQAYL